jgi:hypothetical protein
LYGGTWKDLSNGETGSNSLDRLKYSGGDMARSVAARRCRNPSAMVKTRANSQQASLENCLDFLDKPRASSGFNAGW